MTELMELCGHVLDNRERLIVSNLLTNYRTPAQVAVMINLPKFMVARIGKYALKKIRDECVRQLREQGAPEDLLQKTMAGFN